MEEKQEEERAHRKKRGEGSPTVPSQSGFPYHDGARVGVSPKGAVPGEETTSTHSAN